MGAEQEAPHEKTEDKCGSQHFPDGAPTMRILRNKARCPCRRSDKKKINRPRGSRNQKGSSRVGCWVEREGERRLQGTIEQCRWVVEHDPGGAQGSLLRGVAKPKKRSVNEAHHGVQGKENRRTARISFPVSYSARECVSAAAAHSSLGSGSLSRVRACERASQPSASGNAPCVQEGLQHLRVDEGRRGLRRKGEQTLTRGSDATP